MQKVKIKDEEYEVEDVALSIRSILIDIESTKEKIERYKECNLEEAIIKEKGVLEGLESSLYFLTGRRSNK